MAWKCPQCGFEDNAATASECGGGCGHIHYPRFVVLSSHTGRNLKMSVDTAIGKYLLRALVGEEAVFASEPQFRIQKNASLAAWVIQHAPGAKNPTFYNGAALDESPRALENDATVSIGPEKARLRVCLND